MSVVVFCAVTLEERNFLDSVSCEIHWDVFLLFVITLMDGIRQQIEASLSRTRDVIMEDRYRRLHYDPTFGPYWTSPEGAIVNGRLKHHLPVFSKKKSKDKTDLFEVPAYLKPYKDKYGSVSAHSTSAIYGALRAPHCHALYSPSDVWYASVRSLNSRPRDIVYPVEAYDWREPIYEDITRETRTELRHHPSCGCTKSRRMPSGSSKASRPSPRCKYCASSSSSANGSLNSVPSTKRASVLPEKLKLLSVSEENDEVRTESSTDRMSGYKKRVDPSRSKSSRYVTESATKDSSAVCRKSILECDVTAYDLIKKIAKSPSVSEVDSDDVDDDLSDNAVLKYHRGKGKKNSKLSPSASASKKSSDHSGKKQKFPKSQSENSIYSEAPSVLLGGQRIFTNHQHPPKQSDLVSSNHVNGSSNGNARSSSTRWRQLSASDESICIPEPDYDYSDDSDFENSKFKDLKITYSPPLVRKSSLDDRKNLVKASREISKSMSSLRSEDIEQHPVSIDNDDNTSRTLPSAKFVEDAETVTQDQVNEEQTVTSESIDPKSLPATSADLSTTQSDRALDVYVRNLRDTKYESFSSSDCSSNGGTLSSDYQTWTSSSSGELKSILKKKKRRENAIQEMEDAARVFSDTESKEAQRKKQVQFRSRGDTILVEHIQASEQFIEESVEYAEISDLPLSEGGCESESGICNGVSSGYDGRDAPGQAVIEDEVIYETLNEPMKIVKTSSSSSHFQSLGSTHPLQRREQNPEETEESAVTSRDHAQLKHVQKEIDLEFKAITSIREHSFDGTGPSSPPSKIRSKALSMDLASSLPHQLPARSSSLEDISEAARKSEVARDKSISGRSRRRRTTLPKRRFSDLHLHILLCPTASSRCGDASSSSDDVPLTVPRTHRSLPESPSELEDEPTFCFDFLDKSSKEKALSLSRSTFYVPVESTEKQQNEESKNSGLERSPRLQGDNSLKKSTNGSGQTEHHIVAPSVSDDCNHYTSDDDQLDLPIRDSDLDEATSPLHDDTDDDNLENDYEILDPIYEELPDVSTSPSKRLSSLESPQKSFFEGASKTDILSYLEDAKERGLEDLTEDDIKVITEEDEEEEEEDRKIVTEEEDAGEKKRVIANNNQNQEKPVPESDDAVNSLELIPETSNAETTKANRSPSAEVERNDSGVGTETSKPARISRLLPTDSEEQLCADCDHQVEPMEDEVSGLLFNPLVCKKCELRRCERKEIIIEFVDTELKYGRDLRIIKEEFYRPMEIAGLLGKEQLLSVFLNLDELTSVNMKFSEKLQDALDIATEQGDEDYTTVNIGKLFLETSSMLHAFETYCVKQASASVLLNNLEKEKELLRIFLRVSQMENTLLRRMNLPAFLMVPVQRVTRYPLLLCRLHKVTPFHHKDREALREAQQKVELHLEHINQQTKGVGGTKIWRRISNISASHRRLGNLQDIGSIKLRKMALEVLKWNQDEVRFVMAGKLLFTQVTDYPWNKKGKTLKFTHLHALLVALGKPNSNYRPDLAAENGVLFPRNTGIRDASLLLMKEKNGRFVVVREPLHLGSCVISSDSDADDVFEIQEYTTKEAYLLKGENKKDTREWLRQLRYHAKDLGSWRRRRNALANIMINGMIRQ